MVRWKKIFKSNFSVFIQRKNVSQGKQNLLRLRYFQRVWTGNAGRYIEHTEEVRTKMSESMKGKTHTNEAKKRMSESRKGNTRGRGNKGKSHSEETRKKMSE